MQKTFAPAAQWGDGFAERLDLFLRVCEAGSFSAAARALDLAPSSVARQVTELERQIGSRVFTRSTRRLALTEAGELLREHGSRALAGLEEARQAVSGADRAPRGRVRLTCTPAFGVRHVVPALPPFLKRYPEMTVELLLDDAVVDLVDERIDLAVRIGVLPDSSLMAQRIATQMRVTCAAPSYLRRRGAPREPKDLLEHDCLTTPDQPPSGWWVYGARRLPVKGRFVCRNIDALLHAGLDGAGVLNMATWLVGEDLRAGRLVQLFPQLPPSQGETAISLVRPHGAAPVKVRLLMQHLLDHFGHPPYWDGQK
jgi:DNA-binding transcriptional LysR family regulator